jgi:small subunit ribosomal protein S8
MIPYPIGDMLTRIRNANDRHHANVSMPHSKMKEAVARILVAEGYIEGYEVVESNPRAQLRIGLKYRGDRANAECAIHALYVTTAEIPKPLGGMGISILSTSEGVLSGREAGERGIGGELLCEIW